MLRFEWDPQKATRNLAKHGVSFEEAATVFGDPLGRIASDPRHAVEEERFVLLGLSRRQRFLAVMFAERRAALRIISARTATRRERRDYEESAYES
jgi:uncharacterized DUF497 family protein